jgi:hypothetical protein
MLSNFQEHHGADGAIRQIWWKAFNVITLRQRDTDTIIEMKRISKFPTHKLFCWYVVI